MLYSFNPLKRQHCRRGIPQAEFYFPRNRKTWMYASGGVLLGIVGIVAFDFAGNHELSKSFVTTFTKIYYNMNKMEPMQDAVRIRYKGKNLDLSVEHTEYGDTLKVIENEQNRLPVCWDLEEACFFIEGDEYLNLRVDAYYENGCQYVVIDWKKAQWLFQKDGTEPYVYINRYGKKDTIQNAPRSWEDMSVLSREGDISGEGLFHC